MKQGGDPEINSGFTIVEVMIVLAVTGLLFFAAVLLINGRQNKTEFTVAINNAQQQLQQIINETQSGYYTSTDITCQGNTTGSAPAINNGTNGGCVFLGKVIQFGTSADSSQLVVYPIVGNQQYTSGNTKQQVDTLAHAYPQAVSSAQQTYELHNGLHVVANHMTTHGAVGIISNLADYAGCGGYLCSGAQVFSLYGIRNGASNSPPNSATSDMVGYINAASAANFDGTVSTVTVCLASGTTNQSGLLTISGNGSLAVTLNIYETTSC